MEKRSDREQLMPERNIKMKKTLLSSFILPVFREAAVELIEKDSVTDTMKK